MSARFAIPTFLRNLVYVAVLVFSGFAGWVAWEAWVTFDPGSSYDLLDRIYVSLFAGPLAVYAWIVAYRVRDRIEATDDAIARVGWGGRRTELAWSDVVELRERWWQLRVDLVGRDGTVIHLDYHLERAEELSALVLAHTEGLGVLALKGEPRLPLTVKRSAQFRLFVVGIAVVWGLSAAWLWTNNPVWVIGFGGMLLVGAYRGWLRIVVDEEALTVHYPLRRLRIPRGDILAVALDGGGPPQRLLRAITIEIRGRDKPLVISDARGGGPRVCAALQRALSL